jgi:CRP-like cAMP-binding protein
MKFLEMFCDWKDTVEYAAQSIIFSEGDPADMLYVVISGETGLTLRGESLGTEQAGGIIGEMALMSSATNRATAKALTDVRLARLDRDQLKGFISRDPEFALHLMAVLAKRLRAADRYISARV